jgi:hypothetical protein
MKSIPQTFIVLTICALLTGPATLSARDTRVTIPAGTVVGVRMIDSISSDQNRAGQVFRGSLDHAIRIGNRTVVPRGATAYVKLVDVSSAGRIKGRSELRVELERIRVGNTTYLARSHVVDFRGKSQGKKTAKSAGIGAAVGGGLGALFGGGTGAAVGAGLGAGAGVATRASENGQQIQIAPESLVQFRLAAPLRVP